MVSCRRSEKWPELGGLQSGLSVQHCGADLYRQQQPASSCRWPRVPSNRPGRWGRSSRASPAPLTDRQPGPERDLSSPIDLHNWDFTILTHITEVFFFLTSVHTSFYFLVWKVIPARKTKFSVKDHSWAFESVSI